MSKVEIDPTKMLLRAHKEHVSSGDKHSTCSDKHEKHDPVDIANSQILGVQQCCASFGKISKIAKAFFPFLSLLEDLEKNTMHTDEKCNDPSEKDGHVVPEKDVRDVLAEIGMAIKGIAGSNAMSDASDESKLAFAEFAKKITSISEKENICELELQELVRNWKSSEDTKYLYEVARRVEAGECSGIQKEEVKKAFINALRTFGQAMDDAKKNGSSSTVQALKPGANVLMEAVDTADGQTPEEVAPVLNQALMQSADIAIEVATDPEHAQFLSENTISSLISYAVDAYTFINDFLNEIEEERQAEKEEEAKCEERLEKKRKFNELKARVANTKRRIQYKRALIGELKRKIAVKLERLESSGDVSMSKLRSYVSKKQLLNGKIGDRNEENRLMVKMKHEIAGSAPSSDHCDPAGLNIDFDFMI